MNHFAISVDRLDAEISSGDGLSDENNRKLFADALKRWQRGLEEVTQEAEENQS